MNYKKGDFVQSNHAKYYLQKYYDQFELKNQLGKRKIATGTHLSNYYSVKPHVVRKGSKLNKGFLIMDIKYKS